MKIDSDEEDIQPFTQAIVISNEDEHQEILKEDEKCASVKNPNVNDDRRLFQERVFHVSVPPEDQPDLLAAKRPVELQ